MSTEIGTVYGKREREEQSSEGQPLYDPSSIDVITFWGGKRGLCSQLTIRTKYSQLDAKGVKKLRKLLKRVAKLQRKEA